MDALCNSYLWFSGFASLNDPMEMFDPRVEPSHPLEPLAFDALGLDHSRFLRYAQALATSSVDKSHSSVCCFSETHTSRSMWAYYGGNYSGMCIEFCNQELLRATHLENRLQKVKYLEDLPPFSINSTIEGFRNGDHAPSRIKHSDWEHEKEWRMIDATGQSPHEIPDNSVSAVYLGARIHPEAKSAILAASMDRVFSVFQGVSDGFDLSFKDITPTKKPTRTFGDKYDYLEIGKNLEKINSHIDLEPQSVQAAIEYCRKHPNCECINIIGHDNKINTLFIYIMGLFASGHQSPLRFDFEISENRVSSTPLPPRPLRNHQHDN